MELSTQNILLNRLLLRRKALKAAQPITALRHYCALKNTINCGGLDITAATIQNYFPEKIQTTSIKISQMYIQKTARSRHLPVEKLLRVIHSTEHMKKPRLAAQQKLVHKVILLTFAFRSKRLLNTITQTKNPQTKNTFQVVKATNTAK